MKILKNYNVLFLAIAMLLIAILSLISAIEIKNTKIAMEKLETKVKQIEIQCKLYKEDLEGLYERDIH